MRVLYVLRYYPTLSETFVVREIEAMRRAGVHVEILAIGLRADSALVEPIAGVPVWRPSKRRRRAFAWRHRGRFDVVHAHFDGEASTLASEMAERWRCPWSMTLHAADLFKPSPGIVRRLRSAAAVFTVCEHHQRWIAARYGVHAEIARCGVEVPEVVADPGREPARIVAVARDVPKKDLARLRRAAEGKPLSILSTASAAQVRRALLDAAVFALPCRVAPDGDRDGVPVAMMEAMALGVPVVTRPIAGVGELVNDRVGWIDERFEVVLAEALANPGERALRGRRSRQLITASWSVERGPAVVRDAWDKLRV